MRSVSRKTLLFLIILSTSAFSYEFEYTPKAPDFSKEGERVRQRVIVTQVINGYGFKYWDGSGEYTAILAGIDVPEPTQNSKAIGDAALLGVDIDTYIDAGAAATQRVGYLLYPNNQVDIEIVRLHGKYVFVYAYYVDKDERYPQFDGKCVNEIMIDEGYALALGKSAQHPRVFQYMEREENARNNNRGYWAWIWRSLKKIYVDSGQEYVFTQKPEQKST